ncbi:MAG: DUF58 domain-containing protein [Myxococcota bacterium]|nr:DUF58 domain-containing protein [Myxococcota bacterium]
MNTFLQLTRKYLHIFTGYFPFYFGSLILGFGAFWAYREIGNNQRDYILVLVGACALCLILLGFLSTILGAIYLKIYLARFPFTANISIMEGLRSQTGFRLRLPWWLPLVQCEWRWVEPDVKVELIDDLETTTFLRRGLWDSVMREFVLGDNFGICRIRFRQEVASSVGVEANPGKLQSPMLALGMQDGSDLSHPLGKPYGDKVDIRNYAPGDPVRYILWKIYARTGQLVVRKPEKALQPADRVLAYLISAKDDAAAAGAVTATISGQTLGRDWKLGTDGFPAAVQDREEAKNIIIKSAQASPGQAADLSAFIDDASDSLYQNLLVFAPPSQGNWIDRVIEQSRRINISVIIALDGIQGTRALGSWRRYLFSEEHNPYSCTADKEQLKPIVEKLQAAGIAVKVADRQSGAVIDSTLLYQVAS